MAEIVFEKVRKCFGELEVIKELNLEIREQEFFTFVGPSGCGKSTVLNMIAGLEPVTEGRIYFDKKIINHLSPKDRDVAMVFQSYALYPHMNVYENMAFPLRMKGVSKIEIDKEVKKIADLLGLVSLLYKKPKELSGGQRQRVALGRAIIKRPKIFLMDEPLSNLDARLRIEVRAELKRLHHGLKITTIYVTHDQAEAMSLSDRIAVLYNGEIQQCGTPIEVYTRPKNIFVAGFIGSPPMNFIKAKVINKHPFEIKIAEKIFRPIVKRLPEAEGVTVGIRPEHIEVQSEPTPLQAAVILIEPAGAENWVDIELDRHIIKGKAALEAKLTIGKNAFLKIRHEDLLIFDATGKNLGYREFLN